MLARGVGLSVLLVNMKGSGPSTPSKRCVLCAPFARTRGNPSNTVFNLLRRFCPRHSVASPSVASPSVKRVAPRPVRLRAAG